MPRKVCVITGSRADYGLLRPVMDRTKEDNELELQVVVTGQNLSPDFGETWRAIVADGFAIDARVETLVSGDSGVAVAKSVGLGVIGFADALDRLRPDVAVVLGDRFEVFAAAQAALFLRIPLVHLCGGDVTEGAFDDSIRHCITKLSHIHCVTNATAELRVRQLGEHPDRIFNTGSPGLDPIRTFRPMDRQSLFRELGLEWRPGLIVVTYHPETLAFDGQEAAVRALLAALEGFKDRFAMVLTGSNADPEGRHLGLLLAEFAQAEDAFTFRTSLGQRLYYNALAHADVVVGNSSSGLYEAPSFGKPTVNIGDRQKGRPQATSIINCAAERSAIRTAIERALALDCTDVANPYGDGRGADRVLAAIKSAPPSEVLVRKAFFDLAR